ncbi:MarR family winged helix-turn-helix transcriptional regulator [Paenibacillus hexagrammi]|uniref:MarR family transcriptional regulator n=1 Tax=Paenibacillus hexagrammi TaxID=2908839 RepID=A0ABY3SDW7_9BACL|nr:MarR family transcriptional regulator [Paenibacillus sp. YPD9-1]UJF31326.1 MarR family transcriptional regulator [Paenibacillus sp. YPD9-1]
MSVNDSIGFIISKTARKLNQMLSIQFQPYDITTEQWSVLNKLAEEGGITQKELSCRIEKDPTNVTRILDQLERKGWIERVANEEDRRSFLTYATESGRALSDELEPIEKEFVQSILHSVSDEEIALLRSIMARINANLEAKSSEV